MIMFDKNHPKYFSKQNESQTKLTKTIYSLLFLHVFWILSNFSSKKRKILNSKKSENYFEFMKMIKIPLIMFLFFICDEFERILLIYYFFVVFYIYKNISDN